MIPSIRGRFRSRPMGEIVEEARDLASLGVRELCLVAQDTTRYGEDLYGTYALDALLRELSAIDGHPLAASAVLLPRQNYGRSD